MNSEIRTTGRWGKVLWLWDDHAELGVALEFGIRIVHLSYPGMENLYYVQPADLSDNFVTEKGWRLHGGHRLWLAPESADSYYPDNAPVSCTVEGNSVLIEQTPEPWLQLRKSLRITFTDGTVRLDHRIENLSDTIRTGASWGVNTLDGGGEAEICFEGVRGYNPKRVVSLWGLTNLHDPRLQFSSDRLKATHMQLPEYLKLGLYANPGKAVLRNKGQQLTITFDTHPLECYMDNGCNFELYMCAKFMELETLGVRTEMNPGDSACHTEVWQLSKI